jgi:Ca-activated chloride channel family protein
MGSYSKIVQLLGMPLPGVLLLLIVMSGCDRSQPQNDIQGDNTAGGAAQQQSNPALSWPFISEQEQITLADNLLASNIYVVFDGSGSMSESACSGGEAKIVAAKRALFEFVKAVPGNANFGMVAFDRTGTAERAPLSKVNRDQMNAKINSISAGGGTPLSTAIQIAYDSLTQQAKKQLGYGEYHLVIVTDGMADSGKEPDKLLGTILKQSPVIVHTIGFCIDRKHALNQPGRTIYNTAQDYESLRQGLKSVLAEAPEFSVSGFN